MQPKKGLEVAVEDGMKTGSPEAVFLNRSVESGFEKEALSLLRTPTWC
jgi:hypothetical protein